MRFIGLTFIIIATFFTGCSKPDYSLGTSYVFNPTQEWNPRGFDFYFPETSPIKLKVIQTRRFSKPFIEVAKAIETSCKDRNELSKSYISNLLKGECVFPPEYKSKYTPKYSAFNFLNEATPLSLKYEYEISTDDKKFTVVRIRAYFSAYGIKDSEKSRQITNPTFYNNEFKLIADSLFVNAVELNPDEIK